MEIKLIAAFLYPVHAEDMASSFGPPVEPMPEPVMGLVEDMLLEVEDPRTMSQERIEKILGLKVYISNKKNNSGKITIEYKDLEQFELISNLLTK